MKRHLLCLTIDTDPDGLSGVATDRETLAFDGLEQIQSLPDQLADHGMLGRVPVTWFIRADGQLESRMGSASYLLDKYDNFWTNVRAAGDETSWHPHLYRQNSGTLATLITDPHEAQDELEHLWRKLSSAFQPTSFRNGEGWHTPETYRLVERLGFSCDSTAIPGRAGAAGHPMNWTGAPNQPYFPAPANLCKPGPERAMIELPMNTWHLQAPYDRAPRLRYMNPAVHSHLFAIALKNWENECKFLPADLSIWVMIFHPDEVLATRGDDSLYARSTEVLCGNLVALAESVRRLGHDFEWMTVSKAAESWRRHSQLLIA